MAHNEHPKHGAHPEENEAIFPGFVLVILEQQRLVVVEHGPRLFERDAVFPLIGCGLAAVPVETQLPIARV